MESTLKVKRKYKPMPRWITVSGLKKDQYISLCKFEIVEISEKAAHHLLERGNISLVEDDDDKKIDNQKVETIDEIKEE